MEGGAPGKNGEMELLDDVHIRERLDRAEYTYFTTREYIENSF
jgi:hypothetical protein